ncbi:hypothetical protein CDL12_02191 [Handroanthus impetiginosus]|uniref:DUF7733 domain-containing protein n=1 Tax=Handroanthus impetiginosus TaxID=429701 RepID=A0A2G9I5Q1_9LAMI|nr:hypothetical protein CDL12_02191 [Handroanthus impetiginosus]
MSGKVSPSSHGSPPKEAPRTRRSYFTFHHVNSVVIMTLLSAAGMVTAADFGFVVFSVVYMYFLSKVAFPHTSSLPSPSLFEKTTILNLYVSFAAVVGIFLPVAYIIEGVFKGDKEGNLAAAPHLFLLASQVLMEGVSFWGNFSLPIRVFVPVFYNSRRIFTILDWLIEISYGESGMRSYMGRALAVANMALWCFNLFGFLLPVFLPKAFKIYYSSSNKTKD